MSYCRFSDADCYVFLHVDGYLTCWGCWLADKDAFSFNATDPAVMVAHLEQHRRRGHEVPQDAIDEIAELTIEEVLKAGEQ